MFAAELIHFLPDPVAHHWSGLDSTAVLNAVRDQNKGNFFLAVASLGRQEDFLLWNNASRSLIRVDEHREHYASDPSILSVPRSGVTFSDLIGENAAKAFEVAFETTLTHEQGVSALLFWLQTGEKTPTLMWS